MELERRTTQLMITTTTTTTTNQTQNKKKFRTPTKKLNSKKKKIDHRVWRRSLSLSKAVLQLDLKSSSCIDFPCKEDARAGAPEIRPSHPHLIIPAMSTSPDSFTAAADPDNQESLPLILTIILLIFFFLGFFSIYFCRYIANVSWIQRNQADNQPGQSANGPNNTGLLPSVVDTFPTFTYAMVKEHRRGKCGLECAVCLCEFSDSHVLRLLTVCDHAFHPDCIDLWFESHKTCPVCRKNLDPAEKSPEKTPDVRITMPESDPQEEASEREDEMVVPPLPPPRESLHRYSFKEEEERKDEAGRSGAAAAEARVEMGHMATADWLQRPHSTGHSIVDDDRFTLRLPENVKERIARERNCTGSCIAFGDLSNAAAVVGYRKDDEMAMEGRSHFSNSSPQPPS